MAQDVTLLGASYPAVPAVLLPKTGGGTARFTDVSGTTATAADVASGKVFYAANGSQTTGTGSGGGGGGADLIVGALRPDAELLVAFTYDKYIVQDEGVTIPEYSTTGKSLKASSSLQSVSTDYTSYDYLLVERFLAIPEYSVTTKAKGRCEYWEGTALYEITSMESGFFHSLLEPTLRYATRSISAQVYSLYREIYYASPTALGVYATASYGIYETVTAPSVGSNFVTPKTPLLGIRGHATYLSSDYYGSLDDIRYQWLIEVRRTPKGSLNLDGYGLMTSLAKVNEAIEASDHTLS